jgi:endonuclease/exonuclease/phosphatase family metal-dependent hydrolase
MLMVDPDSPELRFRALTVNTHKGFAFMSGRFMLHDLREAVRGVGAELVFLQEVHGAHRGHAGRVMHWPAAPHYEFLADQLWPQFAYGRNAVYTQGDHGNALLSKYPIVGHENHDISIDRHEVRGMLHCQLEVPGHAVRLHAICVHLGLRESQRERQLEVLCRTIRDCVPLSAPLLVAGDFNDWRHRAHAVLQRCAGLHEVFVQAQGRAARTFPAGFPMLALDRIYARNLRSHAPLALPRQPWARLSDHAPLAAELVL